MSASDTSRREDSENRGPEAQNRSKMQVFEDFRKSTFGGVGIPNSRLRETLRESYGKLTGRCPALLLREIAVNDFKRPLHTSIGGGFLQEPYTSEKFVFVPKPDVDALSFEASTK